MARTVLPIVGAAAGSYFFGSAQLGFLAGSVAGGLVDPGLNQGPRIGEAPVQTSQEGAPRAIIYGTAPCTGFVLCTGPALRTTEITTAGKGAPKTEGQVIYRNYAIGICEGPIAGILRVWENDKLVYDVRPGSLMVAESAVWMENKAIYLGGEDQLPDVYLQLNVSGVGETPAYRGTAYMVFGLEDLTDTGGAIKQYRWEVSMTDTGSSAAAEWFKAVLYTGDGGALATISSLNLSAGGMVLVSRIDAAEPPMIFYLTDTGENVMEMQNETILSGQGPAHNPVISDAVFGADGSIELPVNTSGAQYIAYVFQKSPGNFNIVPYFGNAVSGRTVAHGLGSAPKMHFIRQVDDPAYSFGIMHLQQFAGTDYLVLSDPQNIGDDAGQYWAETPPNATSVTLGNHGQINGSTKSYVLFAFGGDDVYSAAVPSGTEFDAGFDLGLLMVKRRDNTPLNFNTYATATNANFEGADTSVVINGDGAAATVEERIVRNSRGHFTVLAGTAPWTGKTLDIFGVRGSGSSGGPPITLGAIVADLCDRARLPAADYDVSELTDLVEGLTLAGDYNAASAIDTLRGAYFFDKAEYDGQIHFPKRGKPVVATLTIDDLVEEPDTSYREQASELPKKLHLFYQHAASGYAQVKATSSRSSPDARVVGELSRQVPVVLDVDEAAQIADKLHKVAWAEAEGEVKFTVPFSLIRLVPSNCIALSLRGQVSRLRIEQIKDVDGVRNLTLRHDRQGAYTSDATGVPIPEPTLPPSTIVGDTVLAVMDLPARIESEDDLNYLVAGTGTSPGWYGWTLQRSLDAGANYQTVDTFHRAAVMGSLVNDVPSSAAGLTDRTNTLRVQLFRAGHVLESITELQFLTEGGAFALEKPDGSYEVMQYLDANEDSNGIFELSTLHRGRLNSGASAHTAGAKFVLLSDAARIATQFAWIGQALTHRAPSLGQSPELADPQTNTFVGRSQIEWPVAYLTLARNGSDVISGTWYPRHRFGTDVAPVASKNLRGYRVTLADGVLPPVTFDTDPFDPSATSFTYDASALGAPLAVSVSALNRITGPGPATSGTI